MSGSIKAFTYECDDGTLYGVRRDESASEATAGGITLYAPYVAGRASIATGVRERYVNTVLSTDSNIKRVFKIGRAEVFAALTNGSQIIEASGGLANGGTYSVTSKVGERARFLTATDTAQIDGDNP